MDTHGPEDDVVHVWRIPLACTTVHLIWLTSLLPPAEAERAADLGSPQRSRHYVITHGALRTIIAGYLRRPPETLRFGTGPWGKPHLLESGDRSAGRSLEFNLSHSGTLALLAVTAARPVGVDVQHRSREFPAAEFAARFFPADEYALVTAPDTNATAMWSTLWTRKEACVKAAGARIGFGVALPVAGPGEVRRADAGTTRLSGTWRARDLTMPPGYAACVALAGAAPYTVTRYRWDPDAARAAMVGIGEAQ